MLTKLGLHMKAALTSFNTLCQKPFMTMMTILVIAITLALPALFWVTLDNVKHLTMSWQKSGHISLYLKSSLSSEDEKRVLSRVQAAVGVGAATLKSSADSLAELQSQEGMQDMMRYLPENPLPAVILVTPSLDVHDPEKINQLYLQLKSYSEVELAKLDLQWVNRLQAILNFGEKLVNGLIILLALAVVLIIGNTLRLAIQSRYEEIQVLKLIGAKDSFIVRPFLYTGLWYGLGGAILAVLLVNIFLLSLTIGANQLAMAYEMHFSLIGLSVRQISLLVLTAMILSWLGAFVAVKRQLQVIEP